ncbi:MAG: amidase [Alphaproteobacteria bacterium]|nr:amidase [Alphaproteobacteria bacterium]MCB9930695.1 amidase [Alphaproteobacteria bacterium]
MSDADLCFTPATQLLPLVRSKQLSPVELCEAILGHIQTLEPKLNAFVVLDGEGALAQARDLEARITRGEAVGPLAGMTVTIKDLAQTAGLPTQRGSLSLKGNVHDVDTPFVTRLKNAGAIVLGKTTTSEFGWKGVSHSPLTGITHNPWKQGYNAGASSAGAGVAAAAGYGPLHQGSDGAGSIRMPSHFCGVFGLKPSFGRIPGWPVGNMDQVSHNGPMTRTVGDAALMLKVMSGPHPWDHYSLEAPPDDYPALLRKGIKGLKVGYSPDLGHARVDPEVAGLVAAGLKAFEEQGATVEPVSDAEIAFAKDGPEMIRFFWAVHETAGYAHLLPEWEDKLDPGLVACIKAGEGHTALEYMAMRARKLAYMESWHRLMETYDLLVTPAVSVAAFPADRLNPEHWPQHEWDWVQWAEFSYPFNFSNQPAASIPCGFTQAGLPVGLQVVGPRYDDTRVLQAAAAFEEARPWADLRPPV